MGGNHPSNTTEISSGGGPRERDMPSKLLPAVAVLALATAVLALQGSPGIALQGATERVSVSTAGVQGDALSGYPAISADGNIVAFRAFASNLVTCDTNGADDIFARDRQAGTTERVSIDSAGAEANGGSYEAAVSGDGRYVAYRSIATNLVPADTNALGDVFVHDRQTGATERVSVDSAGVQSNGASYEPSVSGDGRYVAFRSAASNLVPGDDNAFQDIFVHDRQTGATERVSVTSAGGQATNNSYEPAISGDGRYVTFRSRAADLVAGDTNANDDIFVHDLQTGTTERVSVASGGGQSDGYSANPTITSDGRFVGFYSNASDLTSNDANAAGDIFEIRT